MQVSESSKDNFVSERELKELEIIDAQGSFLIDDKGNRYIDFEMGWCIGNIGWNNEEVEKVIRSFSGPSYVSPHFHYRAWRELAALLAELTPGNLNKSFRATGGTEAVEIALLAAMEYTGRNKFIGIEGAYHGNSIGAHGLVSNKYELFNWKKLSPPLNEDSLNHLESLLKDQDVAALVMEPIILNLDILMPQKKFMEEMQALCKKYGTLVVMDEVATGFGRTGKLFATEFFNIGPDIMCLAKGITGGAAALGATVMTDEVAESLKEGNFPYSSFGWHPLSVAAAIANIKWMQKEWSNLQENIRSLNEYFKQRLFSMEFEETPDINVVGLAMTVSFENPEYGHKIAQRALKNGLILSKGFSMYPALNLDFDIARQGLDILEESIKDSHTP